MGAASFPPLVELTRGAVRESQHCGVFAVVSPSGMSILSAGDTEHTTFVRSAAKPFQALPLVLAGGAETFRFSAQELAIMCASHLASAEQLEAVQGIHRKVGITADDLLCGSHPPADKLTLRKFIREGLEPTPIVNNCSGKHSGMLALAKMRWGRFFSPEGYSYLDARGEVQREILAQISAFCGVPEGEIQQGIDGCSAPNFAVPLRGFALAAARFAALADGVSLPGFTSHHQQACQLLFNSINSHPEMIRGAGKFDTELIRALRGGIFSKVGAEGYQLIGLRPGIAPSAPEGAGIAIKIIDGDESGRACSVVALVILRKLGIDPALLSSIEGKFGERTLRNWRGIEVGTIRALNP